MTRVGAPSSTPSGDHANGETTAWAAAIGGFWRVVSNLPTGLRVLVVIVLIVTAGAVAYERFSPPDPNAALKDAAVYLRSNGIPAPDHPGADSLNPQNIEADHKASEDADAVRWHFSHTSEDDPPEVAIDSDRKIIYRYFAATDHCVFIRRREGDREVTQWMRDPNYHFHETDNTARRAVALQSQGEQQPVESMPADDRSSLRDLLSVPLAAQGNCLNPHPGQFRYWWGQPLDQCNSPMYRQFPDGCTHYQLYNRCANAWDSRITWTTCVAQHHS